MKDRLAAAAIAMPMMAAVVAFTIWYLSAEPQEWHYFDTPAGVAACYGRHDDINRYVPDQCRIASTPGRHDLLENMGQAG